MRRLTEVMRAHRLLLAIVAAVVVSICGASIAVAGTSAVGTSGRSGRVLARTVPRLVSVAHQLGAVSLTQRIQVTLPLRLPSQAKLNAYVSGEYTPGSRDFHHFLKPAQFGARFGASRSEISTAVSALHELGLSTSKPSANHLFITATGTAAALEHAFGTPLARFERPSLHGLASRLLVGGSTFYANTRDIHLPASLSGAVTGVIGLNDAVLPQSQLALPSRAEVTKVLKGRLRASTTNAEPHSGGAQPCPSAKGGYTAPDLATGYDFNGLYGKNLLGQGMNAALVEFDDYHDSNVATVEQCYKLSTDVVRRLVAGGSGGPPAQGEAEDMADITTLLSLDPDLSHLYVYVAPITGLATVQNEGDAELDLYNAFVSDDKAPVLSSSWGNCEELQNQAYDDLFSTVAEEAAAQGQQIFDASGDSGAVDCRGYPTPTSGSISVEQEAAVPWITGVGGTDLSTSATQSGSLHGEATWNDGGAGGGGQSVVWPMPAWQKSLLSATHDTPQGATNSCGSSSGLCRMVPDIALNADPDAGGAANAPAGPTPPQFSGTQYLAGSPGDVTYCGTNNCELSSLIGLPGTPCASQGAGCWYPIGGTSLATPTAAAAAVLWDQLAKSKGLSGLGFLNPSLYRIAANATKYAKDFYDIAADGYNDSDGLLAGDANDNSNSDQYDSLDCPTGCNPNDLYKAGNGYDMASGLGAVNVTNLGEDLVAEDAAVDLTPDTETMYGYPNGEATTKPVSVTSGYFGSSYTATSSASWLHVRSTGTVPGSLEWDANPAGLSTGTYTGHITVKDSKGHTATLTVTYDVTPAATISASSNLNFSEYAIDSSGTETTATCNGTVWSDELIDSVDFRSGSYDTYTPDPNSRQPLTIKNTGPAGSVLHYEVLYVTPTGGWLTTDLNPNNDPTGFQTTPQQPLVASTGALGSGQSTQVKFASVANSNALGGYPAMNQGTYHAIIEVRDMADPSTIDTVPVTMSLYGTGKTASDVAADTPTVSPSPSRLSVSLAPGKSKTVDLKLSDSSKTCGYVYSMESKATWATINKDLYSGTVSVPAATSAPSSASDTGSGNGFTPVTISAKGLTGGRTYNTSIEINTQNAVPNPTTVPVTLKVTGGSSKNGGGKHKKHPKPKKKKPKKKTCRLSKKLTLRMHPVKHAKRTTKTVVYINGKRVRTVRKHNIKSVTIKRPKKAKFTVKDISTFSNGEIVSRTRTYNGCKVSKWSRPKVLRKPRRR